jgi:hypothetical protein
MAELSSGLGRRSDGAWRSPVVGDGSNDGREESTA